MHVHPAHACPSLAAADRLGVQILARLARTPDAALPAEALAAMEELAALAGFGRAALLGPAGPGQAGRQETASVLLHWAKGAAPAAPWPDAVLAVAAPAEPVLRVLPGLADQPFAPLTEAGAEGPRPGVADPSLAAAMGAEGAAAVLLVPLQGAEHPPAGAGPAVLRLDWTDPAAWPGAALVQRLEPVLAGLGALVLRAAGGGVAPAIAQEVVLRTGDMVVVTDAARRIVWVNPAFTARTGYTLAEAMGQTPGQLLQGPDTDPAEIARLRAALDAGRPVRSEIRNVTRDGRGYWNALDIQPCHDAAGRLTGFVSVQTDVTDRKAEEERRRTAEAAVATERARLANALEALPDPVALFDAEERLVIANAHFRKLYDFFGPSLRPGVTLEEMLRDLIGRTPPPDAAGREDAWVAERLAALRTEPRLQEVQHADGRWWRKLHMPTADGGVLRARIEITARKAEQAELERLAREASAARALLEGAVAVLPDAFVVFDADDRLVMCNERNREMFPLSAHAIRPGATFEDILRVSVAAGEVADAVGREEAFIAERMARHRAPHNDHEYQLSDGRWLRMIERTMPDGSRVVMRSDITALKATEQRLADIIAGARVATWEWNERDGVSIINERYAEILGHRLEDITPMTDAMFQSLVHPDDAPPVNAAIGALFAGESGFYDVEYRLRHARGHWVWVQARGRVTRRDSEGRVLVFAGIFLDISERKALEGRLEAERGFLASLMETSVSGIVALDHQGRAVFANREAEALLGIPQGATMPFDLDSIGWRRQTLAGAPLEWEHLAFRRVMASGEVVRDVRYAIVWPDGRRRCLSVNAAPIDHPTSGARVVVSVTDITDQLDAEADLRRALDDAARTAARFAEVAAISRSWVWEQDADLRFTYQSESIRDLVNADLAEALGHTREELYSRRPDVRDSANWDGLEARIAARAPFSGFVFRIHDREGRETFIEIAGKPIFDAEGRFQGYRGAGRDVTTLIQARLAAEEASRTKSQFLANMSHEIRTPLNGVLGMADLLHAELDDPRRREMVAVIRNSGEGLLTLLNDILDMSKIEAGKMTLEAVRFTPAELVARTLALHAPVAREKGLVLEAHCHPETPGWREGDPHRLQQILHNLLSNAIRFTEAGRVRLRLDAPPGAPLTLEVADTGIGMSKAQIDRLFDPFAQAESSTSRRYGGTGLGSSIVKKLVELMGGAIAVESRVGVGTTVRITLPLRESAQDGVPQPTPPAPVLEDRPLAGLRLLAADDNATNRKLLELILTRAGAEPTVLNDGRAAVEAWSPERFDLLLLDIAMPGMDGVEALAAIRTRAAMAGAPPPRSVAITANAMTHQVDGYLAAGFDAHVAKPFRRETLIATLLRLAGR